MSDPTMDDFLSEENEVGKEEYELSPRSASPTPASPFPPASPSQPDDHAHFASETQQPEPQHEQAQAQLPLSQQFPTLAEDFLAPTNPAAFRQSEHVKKAAARVGMQPPAPVTAPVQVQKPVNVGGVQSASFSIAQMNKKRALEEKQPAPTGMQDAVNKKPRASSSSSHPAPPHLPLPLPLPFSLTPSSTPLSSTPPTSTPHPTASGATHTTAAAAPAAAMPGAPVANGGLLTESEQLDADEFDHLFQMKSTTASAKEFVKASTMQNQRASSHTAPITAAAPVSRSLIPPSLRPSIASSSSSTAAAAPRLARPALAPPPPAAKNKPVLAPPPPALAPLPPPPPPPAPAPAPVMAPPPTAPQPVPPQPQQQQQQQQQSLSPAPAQTPSQMIATESILPQPSANRPLVAQSVPPVPPAPPAPVAAPTMPIAPPSLPPFSPPPKPAIVESSSSAASASRDLRTATPAPKAELASPMPPALLPRHVSSPAAAVASAAAAPAVVTASPHFFTPSRSPLPPPVHSTPTYSSYTVDLTDESSGGVGGGSTVGIERLFPGPIGRLRRSSMKMKSESASTPFVKNSREDPLDLTRDNTGERVEQRLAFSSQRSVEDESGAALNLYDPDFMLPSWTALMQPYGSPLPSTQAIWLEYSASTRTQEPNSLTTASSSSSSSSQPRPFSYSLDTAGAVPRSILHTLLSDPQQTAGLSQYSLEAVRRDVELWGCNLAFLSHPLVRYKGKVPRIFCLIAAVHSSFHSSSSGGSGSGGSSSDIRLELKDPFGSLHACMSREVLSKFPSILALHTGMELANCVLFHAGPSPSERVLIITPSNIKRTCRLQDEVTRMRFSDMQQQQQQREMMEQEMEQQRMELQA